MPSRLAQREAIRDAEKTDVPSLPLLAIRGYLCFRCLEPSKTPSKNGEQPSLIKCSGCRRAGYCSVECQLQDWHVGHRMHCEPLQAVNALERDQELSDGEQSWDEYAQGLHHKAQVAKSELRHHHIHSGDMVQAVIGQPYCSTCHRSDMQMTPSTEESNAFERTNRKPSLAPCPICRLVFTCGECQSSHSYTECKHYCLLGEVEQYKLRRFDADSTITAVERTASPQKVAEQRDLALTDGWLDYYRWISGTSDDDAAHTNDGISADFSYSATPNQTQTQADLSRDRWLHLLLATDSMTVPLSVIAALEDSLPSLRTKTSLNLHLVGAAGKEFRNLSLFEELLHLLPALQHLNIVLAGPESPGASAGQTGDAGQEITMACCATCTARGRQRTVTSFQGGYHEYALRPAYRQPDLAILFHSGRSQAAVEGWKPTTRFLVDTGTPTLCTTYTAREASEEAAELVQLGARFVVPPEVNKWRGLVPLPELLEGPEHGAYYNNFYRYIFRGRE